MKRYIKTPLKYALPLLCIGALVLTVSISGCTSTTNSTASPTATPSVNDPLLSAIVANVVKNNSNSHPTITWYPAGQTQGGSESNRNSVLVSGLPIGNVSFVNEGSIANATSDFKNITAGGGLTAAPTHYAQAEVTAALGHPLTVVKDEAMPISGAPNAEWIQYDSIIVYVNA